MFVAEGMSASAEFREQHEIDSVIRALEDKGYKPILRSMLATASEVVQAPRSAIPVQALTDRRSNFVRQESHPTVSGDLLFKDDLAFVVQPMGQSLHVWQIRHHDCSSDASGFCSIVESAVRSRLDGRRVRGMNFTWRPIKERPRRPMTMGRFYAEPKLETKAAEYSAEEAQASRLLVASDVRAFLVRLAQAGKARAADTADEAKKLNVEGLLAVDLVRREYLVSCRKASHTICTVQDLSQLESGAGSAFTCSVCGRAFKDELIHEIYAVAERGKKLLAGSRWMTIWITELLLAAGIAKDSIGWNAAAGEDEIDIVTHALGSRVFFELKDREFGLGDAYPFAYRLSRYGGSFGIIVTTDRIADEAKRFFQEQRGNMSAQMILVEGETAIEKDIMRHVDRMSRVGIARLLVELTQALALDPMPVVHAWMEQVALRRATANKALQATGLAFGSARA